MTNAAVETAPEPISTRGGSAYRLLRILTHVKPGEAGTAFLLTLNIFLLLLAYYLIKPVRDANMLTNWGPYAQTYLAGAQAVLFIFVVKAFSRLSSKVPRQILITWVTAFFISNLALFVLLFLWGLPAKTMAIVFFIWVGIFNIIIVAQFWSFANDIYTEEAGKRLFPMIAVGQTCGAVFGSLIAESLIRPLGKNYTYYLMLIAGAVLVVCIGLSIFIHKREIGEIRARRARQDAKAREAALAKEQPLKKGGGFRLIFKSRYLLFYALLIFSLNFVNYMGEFIFRITADQTAVNAVRTGTTGGLDQGQFTSIIYTKYHFLYNLIALLVQLFLVSRIFKWIGVSGALLFLPIIALGGYGMVGVMGASMLLIKWVKGLENGLDYSLMNTIKGAIFLVTSREEKYKAKAAAESFFYRGGDAFAALCVFVGSTYLGFAAKSFAGLCVFVTLVWIVLCFLVMREYKKIKAALPPA